MAAQELRDLRAARDDLERRVHDLKLTRQVTMQSLPSIRLVQENDKGLVTKINSTLVNTVPLWETQLAQAVTIHRGREAAGVVKEASDLTNELLTRNAENLRQANDEIRTEMERGVFDIEAIEKANADLIAHDRGEPAHRRRGQGQARRRRGEPGAHGGRAQGDAGRRQGARPASAAPAAARRDRPEGAMATGAAQAGPRTGRRRPRADRRPRCLGGAAAALALAGCGLPGPSTAGAGRPPGAVGGRRRRRPTRRRRRGARATSTPASRAI